MTAAEIRAELSIHTIEFEQALDRGLPHSQLKETYNKLKKLQYQLSMAEVEEREKNPAPPHDLIIR